MKRSIVFLAAAAALIVTVSTLYLISSHAISESESTEIPLIRGVTFASVNAVATPSFIPVVVVSLVLLALLLIPVICICAGTEARKRKRNDNNICKDDDEPSAVEITVQTSPVAAQVSRQFIDPIRVRRGLTASGNVPKLGIPNPARPQLEEPVVDAGGMFVEFNAPPQVPSSKSFETEFNDLLETSSKSKHDASK